MLGSSAGICCVALAALLCCLYTAAGSQAVEQWNWTEVLGETAVRNCSCSLFN
jgi:hypothetical protein